MDVHTSREIEHLLVGLRERKGSAGMLQKIDTFAHSEHSRPCRTAIMIDSKISGWEIGACGRCPLMYLRNSLTLFGKEGHPFNSIANVKESFQTYMH